MRLRQQPIADAEVAACEVYLRINSGDRSVTRVEWRELGRNHYRQPLRSRQILLTGEQLRTIYRRLHDINFDTCWHARERWPAVNHHLWRLQALYAGGDCFLA